MFLIIKKHFLPLLFPAFTLFTIGYGVDDWAPESLEGIFTKITIDIPAHEMNVWNEYTYPKFIPNKLFLYSQWYDVWGFNEKQTFSTMFFDYRKTSPKSFNLKYGFLIRRHFL